MKYLVEFTDYMTGRTRAFNVMHVVDILCMDTGNARITTAEHTDGVHVSESYEYVRNTIDEKLGQIYPYGAQP